MRALNDTANWIIDPWAFARNRQTLAAKLQLKQLQTLQQWAKNDQDTVEFTIFGNIDEYGRSRLSGQIHVTLHAECQRCLDMMDFPVDHNFDYVLIRHLAQEQQIVDGSESFLCEEDELNLTWFIEEEILLAMPMIAKHENCVLPKMAQKVEETQSIRQNPFTDLKKIIETQETPHGRSTKS